MKRAGTKATLENGICVQIYNTGDINRDGQLEHTILVSHDENGAGLYLTISELQSVLDWYHNETVSEDRKA
jgi:hypothetical protein